MSCGALYTRNCGCSKGSLEDKILVPKPPQNCATCGNPVDGLNIQSCAFMRKCLNEGRYTIHNGNTSESSNHHTNVRTLLSVHSTCNSGDENLFTYDSKLNYVNDSPNVFNHPPQSSLNSCEFCGNDALCTGVENLVPIPSKFKGISEDTYDVPVYEDPSTFDALGNHSEILSDSNNDGTSSDDDSYENIEYIEASPFNLEIISLEEVNDVDRNIKDEF
ncbi:hypothetical protein Tco_1398060 [Tanacetum coccineum]